MHNDVVLPGVAAMNRQLGMYSKIPIGLPIAPMLNVNPPD
jgi:hypothetical protein